jgi:hypothetical protein
VAELDDPNERTRLVWKVTHQLVAWFEHDEGHDHSDDMASADADGERG